MTSQTDITQEIRDVLGISHKDDESFAQTENYSNAIEQFGIENIAATIDGTVSNGTYVVTLRSNWDEATFHPEVESAYVDANFEYNPETGFNVVTVFKFTTDVTKVQYNISTGEYEVTSKYDGKVISAGTTVDQNGNVDVQFKISDLLDFTGKIGVNNNDLGVSLKIDLSKIGLEGQIKTSEGEFQSAGMLAHLSNNTDFDGLGFKVEKGSTEIKVVELSQDYFGAQPGEIPYNFSGWTDSTYQSLASDPVLNEMVTGDFAITQQEYRTAIQSGMEDFGWSMARAHEEVIKGWEEFLIEQPNLDPSVTSANYITDSIILRPAPVGVQLNTYTEPTAESLVEVIQKGIVDENGNELPPSNNGKVLLPDENGNLVKHTFVSSEAVDLVASDIGVSTQDLLNKAHNNYVAGRQTAIDAGNGYFMYLFKEGDTWDITPPDLDSRYYLKINTNADNPTSVPVDSFVELMNLEVDISGSSETAVQTLQNVPLTDFVAKLATVTDGGNDELYYGYGNGMNLEEAFNEMDITYDPQDIVNLLDSNSISYGGYVKDGVLGNSNGNNYYMSEVADSLVSSGNALTSFVNTQAGVYLENTFDANNLNAAISSFFSKHGQDLVNGDLSIEDATKLFVVEIATLGLGTTVAEQILSFEMNELISVFNNGSSTQQELDVALNSVDLEQTGDLERTLDYIGFRNSSKLAENIASIIGRFTIDVAANSYGWDGEQFAKAGVAAVTGVTVDHFVTEYLKISGASGAGTVSALTTLAVGLTESGDYDNGDWASLGVSTGIAFGAAYASAAVGSAIATAGGLGFATGAALSGAVGTTIASSVGLGSVITGGSIAAIGLGAAALAGVGLVIALAANSAISSIYKGKKFYAGEYGDMAALINSTYQVQQIDDGNGNMIDAVVAVNPSGSVVVLQEGITHIIGNSGPDNLIGNSLDNVISGDLGSDYIEGKEGNDTIFAEKGNDHIVGGDGDDILDGGIENDEIIGGDGDDIIIGNTGLEFILGGNGNDSISSGDHQDIVLAGNNDDLVEGGDGHDFIDLGAGNDVAEGGDGDDLILGSIGNDAIGGGDGEDQIFGEDGNDNLAGGNDNDYLDGGLGSDIIYGDNGDDVIRGNFGDDFLGGSLGDDSLDGGEGNDIIDGGMDNDLLVGGIGNDILIGGYGNDIIYAGIGNDNLKGGDGNDKYYFKINDGINSISDTDGNDTIIIKNVSSTYRAGLSRLDRGPNSV